MRLALLEVCSTPSLNHPGVLHLTFDGDSVAYGTWLTIWELAEEGMAPVMQAGDMPEIRLERCQKPLGQRGSTPWQLLHQQKECGSCCTGGPPPLGGGDDLSERPVPLTNLAAVNRRDDRTE